MAPGLFPLPQKEDIMLGFLRSTVEENSSVDTADMKPLK
jgi:hypothetical protein